MTSDGFAPPAAVVLAAGASRRAGTADKLVADVGGAPMIRRVVDTASEAGLAPIVVVVRAGDRRVARALGGLDVVQVPNGASERGMSSSIRCGLEALPAHAPGAAVVLGDMPWVATETLRALQRAFADTGGRGVVVPIHEGRRGNPVIWPREFFAEIAALQGDVGARGLLETHAAAVLEVPVADPGVLMDVDTEEEVAALVDLPPRLRG